MKTITSRSNEQIKEVCELHEVKGRTQHKKFLGQGERVCTTLIKNRMKLVQLYVTQEYMTQAQKLANDFFITLVNKSVMEKISTLTSASGMIGVFEIPATPPLAQLKSGLVMAQIADPGNMGTLIRTAAALNVKNIVIVEGADVWSPKVIQATAGTIALVDIFVLSWQALVTWKKDARLAALVVKGGKNPSDINAQNLLLVVGNEATGIQPSWLRDCTDYITIPMPGDVESLNAAVAGSLGLYLTFGKGA